jgi:hypothetical protein
MKGQTKVRATADKGKQTVGTPAPATISSELIRVVNQLLTQEFQSHGPERRRFRAELEVAHLSIRLAEIHGTKIPAQHLPEAAELLTRAGAALDCERGRGEREATARIDEALSAHVREGLLEQYIPWNKIVRPKGKKKDGRYSERGFAKLLFNYVRDLYDRKGEQIIGTLDCENPDYEAAAELLASWPPVMTDFAAFAVLRSIKNKAEAKRIVSTWRANFEPAAYEHLLNSAKMGRLTQVDLKSVYEFRDRLNRKKTERATKAAAAKRQQ